MAKEEKSVVQLLLEAHKRGIKLAIERSIRTGVPLVFEKNGKIIEVPPKYKYVKVPIKKRKSLKPKKSI